MSHPAIVRRSDDPAAPPEIDPLIGGVIAGRFTVLSRLGAGAMGTVYRAKQAPTGREVAVKILRSDRALDEPSRARFLREGRANSLLTSPHTVTVFDFGAGETGEFYLAMELLEGESLGQRLKRRGRLDVGTAVAIARQALRSLSEAHAKGIIHRDLKPDNLFFARVRTNERDEEIVKVLDFGVAKMLHADEELAMNPIETQAGTVFGTPRYMSPEQAQGKPLDARSDLYSLGVILYQMLTGRAPFTDNDAIVVMARHIKTMPRLMTEVAPEANIPADVESAVMRVLSKEPSRRPDTADAMAAELARALETPAPATSGMRASIAPPAERRSEAPPPEGATARPRRGWWIAGGIAVGVATALVLAVLALLAPRRLAPLAGRALSAVPFGAPSARVPTSPPPPATSPPRAISAPAPPAPATSAPTIATGTADPVRVRTAPPPSSHDVAPRGKERTPVIGLRAPQRRPVARPATPAAPGAPPAPASTPAPATTAAAGSVGSGYLE